MRILLVAPRGLADLLVSFLIRRGIGCAPAGTAAAAHRVLAREAPDLALVHYRLPDASGLLLATHWAHTRPDVPVLLTALMPAPRFAFLAAACGARGLWYFATPLDQLPRALTRVAQGQTSFDGPGVVLDRATPHPPFTPRQVEILLQLGTGSPRRQIASYLGITTATLDEHLQALRVRAGVANNPALVRLATEMGLGAPLLAERLPTGEGGERDESRKGSVPTAQTACRTSDLRRG